MRRPLAEIDILEIWDCIADDSLADADRWVDRIDEQFSLPAAQPMIGRSRDELAPGMRSWEDCGAARLGTENGGQRVEAEQVSRDFWKITMSQAGLVSTIWQRLGL